MSTKARVSLWIACFLWAISFIATKVALEEAPPLFVVGARLVVSGFCFLIWLYRRGKFETHGIGEMGRLLALSLLGTGPHYGLQTIGLQYTSASNASIYAVTGPVCIAILGAIWLGERLTLRKSLGILMAVTGVLWVMGWHTVREFHLGVKQIGDGLVLGSIVLWAGFTVYGKRLMQQRGALYVIGMATIMGSLLTLPLGIADLVKYGRPISAIHWKAWISIGFLGIGCSFMATFLYFRALEETDSQKVGIYLYTIPPMTYLIAFLFLGERIGWELLLGSTLILSGVYVTERG